MRAAKDPINVDLEYDLDESIGEVPLIAEDFSRVIVNLCTNAFDAMRDKLSANGSHDSYKPKLAIRTGKLGDQVNIEVEDNGPGIPDELKDKIMQPFFIISNGNGTTFSIKLPAEK
jgi:signal transduction histidine kinase